MTMTKTKKCHHLVARRKIKHGTYECMCGATIVKWGFV